MWPRKLTVNTQKRLALLGLPLASRRLDPIITLIDSWETATRFPTRKGVLVVLVQNPPTSRIVPGIHTSALTLHTTTASYTVVIAPSRTTRVTMSMTACSSVITTEMMDLDQQLAQLLGTMTLQGAWNAKANMARDAPNMGYALHSTMAVHDECMSDSSDAEDAAAYEQSLHHPHPPSSNSASSIPLLPSFTVGSAVSAGRVLPGCGLLQAIQDQLCSDSYHTTAGAYLEVIFTHRELLYACPQLHRGCALGFSELAMMLDRREWRADRDGDGEAAAAFRHEAGLTAHVAA